jgi:hypothetical protein
MGHMTKKTRTIGEVGISPSVIEAVWQRQATEEAIAGATAVIGSPIPPGTPIGRLSDTEWGWIVAGILFGWIATRARQAASENLDTEQTIRRIALDSNPWDVGAVEAILPALADALPDFDWSRPVRLATSGDDRVPAHRAAPCAHGTRSAGLQ